MLLFPGAYFLPSVAREDKNLRVIPLKTSDGISIQLYTFADSPKHKRAILVFHGNADLAARKIYELAFLKDKYNIYSMEFRGFNKNKGRPSERTLNLDAKAALKYLRSQGYEGIIYYGHSIGTAVAVRLVKEEVPLALILEAPLDNLLNAAHSAFPFLPKFMIRMLLKDKFNSTKTLSRIVVPNVLIMHGEKDNILEIQMARNLFAKINSPNKVFKVYERGGHMNLLHFARKDLQEFLSNLKRPKTSEFEADNKI